jgi:hypothetical protein
LIKQRLLVSDNLAIEMIVFDKSLQGLNGLSQAEPLRRFTTGLYFFAVSRHFGIPQHFALLNLLAYKVIELADKVIGQMEAFLEQEASGLSLPVLFLVLLDELVVDVFLFLDQVQNIRYVLFKEPVFRVGFGLDLVVKSHPDELSDFLIVQLQVLCELLQHLDLLLLLLLFHQVRVLCILQLLDDRLLPRVLLLLLLAFAPVLPAGLSQRRYLGSDLGHLPF